jgi:hypothetical protein
MTRHDRMPVLIDQKIKCRLRLSAEIPFNSTIKIEPGFVQPLPVIEEPCDPHWWLRRKLKQGNMQPK